MNKFVMVVIVLLSTSGMVLEETVAGEEKKLSSIDLLSVDIEQLINIKVDMTVAASRVEERLSSSPSAVTVITSYEIKSFGYKTIADVLMSQKGFYITYDRNYNYAGIRGLYKAGDYNTRILLLIDGHKINDNIYDQAFIGTDFLLDLSLIDRIEIVRGPVSSLYGGNGLFGVINIITKRPNKNKFSFIAGSQDTYYGRVTLYKGISEREYLMGSASYYQSHGGRLYFKEFDIPNVSDGRNYKGDYDRFPSFFAKAVFDDFSATAGCISRKKGVPTGAWETVYNDDRNFSVDKRAFFDLRYQQMITM